MIYALIKEDTFLKTVMDNDAWYFAVTTPKSKFLNQNVWVPFLITNFGGNNHNRNSI
jgi:hypothetical protein